MRYMKNGRLLAGVAVAGLTACSAAMAQQRVDDGALSGAGKERGEWLTYGLDYAETRHSPLKLLNPDNVSGLSPAWSYEVGEAAAGQEATPLVWNGVMYGITNWSVTFAVDARTGKELWRWDPEVERSIDDPQDDRVCCGPVSRGVALYDGKVIVPVLDGRLAALDAATGRILWQVQATPREERYTFTMAPRVVRNKIILGGAGGEFLVRGYFSAFDAETGREIWRFYTVPGDPSQPFENEAMRRAAETWSGEWWKLGGGGNVWDAISYDPELDLIYVGTANGAPWPQELRGSTRMDNLYVCSILAVKAETGELAWFYQATPGDSWDYDAVQQLVLADIPIDGRERKVLMQANKNGFLYVLDRVTGEFISAAPFARVNWASGVDPQTGRPIINPEAYYEAGPARIAPSAGGAANWAPKAFSPDTGLFYFPASTNSSFVFAVNRDFVPAPGLPPVVRVGVARDSTASPSELPYIGPEPLEGQRGALIAWDPSTQEERWRADGGGGIGGGVLTTSGNLVFQVRQDGRLLAYRAGDGLKLLDLETELNAGMGPPVTFEIDGRQYIALMGNQVENTGGASTRTAMLLAFTLVQVQD